MLACYREDAGISAGQGQICCSRGPQYIFSQCVSPDCPHPCLYSNPNVSACTYRSTLPRPARLGRAGGRWDDASGEWRGFGPCLWGTATCTCSLQVVLSAFPPPRFGVWRGCGLVGRARESPFVGARRFGQVQKRKKVKRCNSGPALAQACELVPPATARHGPTVAPPAAGIQPPAHPPFPQIPKSENHPRRFLPACACDRPWPTVPAPVPAWLAFNLDPTSFTSGRASSSLSVSTPFFLLAPILFLSPLASLVSRLSQHVGLRSSLSPSITFPAVLNTTFQIVITISHRPIPRRDSTRPHIVRTSCAHAHKLL